MTKAEFAGIRRWIMARWPAAKRWTQGQWGALYEDLVIYPAEVVQLALERYRDGGNFAVPTVAMLRPICKEIVLYTPTLNALPVAPPPDVGPEILDEFKEAHEGKSPVEWAKHLAGKQ